MDWNKFTQYSNLILGAGLTVYGANTSASGYYGAADNAITAGEIEAQSALTGGAMTADAYRQSGLAAEMMADYNSKVIDANRNQQLRGVREQVSNVISGNIAGQGVTGLSTSSRSFLAVANATISRAESDVQAINNTANQQMAVTKYQGQLAKTSYENQARATEYSSQVQAITARYQADVSSSQAEYQAKSTQGSAYASAVTGLLRGATSLLGS